MFCINVIDSRSNFSVHEINKSTGSPEYFLIFSFFCTTVSTLAFVLFSTYMFFVVLISFRIDLPAPPKPKSNIFESFKLIFLDFMSAIKPLPSVDVASISPYKQYTESRLVENSIATISL